MKRFVVLLAGAVIVGRLLDSWHFPVAWLLGPLLVGLFASLGHSRPLPLDPRYQMLGQVILGVYLASGFSLETLKTSAAYALPLLLAVIITGSLSLLNGYLLWRWAGVEPATGFLGSLPGAASSLVVMSDELGADAVAGSSGPETSPVGLPATVASSVAATSSATATAPVLLNFLLLAACGAVGTWAGRLARLPSPAFLGSFLLALVTGWATGLVSPYRLWLPAWFAAGGLLLVGLSIGVRFDLATARGLGNVVIVESVLVLVLILISLAIGYGFHLLTGVDARTAVLGSTPGGMEVMVMTAVQLGADAGLVLAMQMTRWFIILLAGPWVALHLAGRSSPSTAAK